MYEYRQGGKSTTILDVRCPNYENLRDSHILQLQLKIVENKVIYDYESRCALRSVKRDIRTPLLAVVTNTILKVQIGVISSRIALEHGIKPRLLEKDTHSILPHSLRT